MVNTYMRCWKRGRCTWMEQTENKSDGGYYCVDDNGGAGDSAFACDGTGLRSSHRHYNLNTFYNDADRDDYDGGDEFDT